VAMIITIATSYDSLIQNNTLELVTFNTRICCLNQIHFVDLQEFLYHSNKISVWMN
jgi:hypothetical protein